MAEGLESKEVIRFLNSKNIKFNCDAFEEADIDGLQLLNMVECECTDVWK